MFATIFSRAFSTHNIALKFSRFQKTQKKIIQVQKDQATLSQKLGELLKYSSCEQVGDIQNLQAQLTTRSKKEIVLVRKTRELEKEIKEHPEAAECHRKSNKLR